MTGEAPIDSPSRDAPPAPSWSFSQAIDALVAAARQAGKPSFVWLAGWVYMTLAPGWHQGWTLGSALFNWDVLFGGSSDSLPPSFTDGLRTTSPSAFGPMTILGAGPTADMAEVIFAGGFVFILLLPLLLVGFRLQAGLARLSSHRSWLAALEASGTGRSPYLRQAWHAGRGLTLSALFLDLLTWFMLLACGAFMLGPVFFLDQLAGNLPGNLNLGALFAPAALFLLGYGFLLSVLFQLALQSLSHNSRGAGSAFQHAWRLARHTPRATLSAVMVDVLLQVVGVALTWLVSFSLTISCVGIVLVPFASLAIMGFLGTARCAFWARAYRALGGVTADDGLPGMSPGAVGQSA
ncbi:MAG: hypothetical protein QF724_12010 [Planctomycetota bacterium]|nr:hypothetical protein [Planctomycetota bacterium]MDP6370441.1 hypothetical protein [Planctomycetota bacterium]MDP6521047.1 hypothetical protein [Planctomycetota bacterium]MDP6839650.1 hypothetical protein [Planctomycetota bacterium]